MKSLTRFTLLLSVVFCGLAALASAANAQTTVDPLEDLRTNDSGSGPFEGDSNAAQSSIFDIIHNSVLSNGTSAEEFNEARSENIQEEAASFQEQQRRLMEQRNAAEAAEPAQITPAQ
ncbi:MAG: hypothetical protein ACFB4J_15940 [Elainellaceae cyanobacterium]